jgi:hypothetical protein
MALFPNVPKQNFFAGFCAGFCTGSTGFAGISG